MKNNFLLFSKAVSARSILDFPSWFDLENTLAIGLLLAKYY
jgi:hypothetical protein